MLNERELHAREEIAFEAYNKTINIEAQLMVLMANRYILPAALEYQTGRSARRSSAAKAAGAPSKQGKALLKTLAKLIDTLKGTPTRWPRRSSTTAAARTSTRSTSATRSSR